MRNALLAAGLAALLACSGSSAPDSVTSPGAAPDMERRGELLSLACQACHSFARGGAHIVGPNLFGFFGRAAGTALGFDNYSPALKDSGIIWSPAELERWLADPAGFLPGTTMAFTGYRSAEDRAALIDYLFRATVPAPQNVN
jgi:cytochrome c